MNIRQTAQDFKNRSIRALAQAITLAESRLKEHESQAIELLKILGPPQKLSKIVAFSGPPGVGKSTLIESVGLSLVGQGFTVAVLAIDPSSAVIGGSILGDKTRMLKLAQHESAFIRPSPSKGFFGGLGPSSKLAIDLCEIFGFDFILIETVGVGQSEDLAYYLCDCFVGVLQPGSGDELQALKKGLYERTDFLVVNKADGHLEQMARDMVQQQKSAHALSLGKKIRPIIALSAREKTGITGLLDTIEFHFKNLHLATSPRRKEQTAFWMKKMTLDIVMRQIEQSPSFNILLKKSVDEINYSWKPLHESARSLSKSILPPI